MDENERREVNVNLEFPKEYNVKMPETRLGASAGFRNFLLLIIAAALVALAIPAIYNYRLARKTNESAVVAKSTSDDNIEQAKNTIYENSIVGVMINNFQRSTKWSFFVSNTGHYVVDADGDIPNPSMFLTLTKNSDRISYANRISELNKLTPSDVTNMTFHIQFIKRLGVVYETDFNHYSCYFTSVDVTLKDGTKKTINTSGTDILDYIEAYLQESIK